MKGGGETSSSVDREWRAFQMILEAGDEGLLQTEMWNRLGITGQEGSKIARRFEEKGIIKRRRELHEGRQTYRLFSTKKTVTLDSIMGCPCAACRDMDRCLPGRQISPTLCPVLTEWIDLNASENTRETPHPHFASIQ